MPKKGIPFEPQDIVFDEEPIRTTEEFHVYGSMKIKLSQRRMIKIDVGDIIKVYSPTDDSYHYGILRKMWYELGSKASRCKIQWFVQAKELNEVAQRLLGLSPEGDLILCDVVDDYSMKYIVGYVDISFFFSNHIPEFAFEDLLEIDKGFTCRYFLHIPNRLLRITQDQEDHLIEYENMMDEEEEEEEEKNDGSILQISKFLESNKNGEGLIVNIRRIQTLDISTRKKKQLDALLVRAAKKFEGILSDEEEEDKKRSKKPKLKSKNKKSSKKTSKNQKAEEKLDSDSLSKKTGKRGPYKSRKKKTAKKKKKTTKKKKEAAEEKMKKDEEQKKKDEEQKKVEETEATFLRRSSRVPVPRKLEQDMVYGLTNIGKMNFVGAVQDDYQWVDEYLDMEEEHHSKELSTFKLNSIHEPSHKDKQKRKKGGTMVTKQSPLKAKRSWDEFGVGKTGEFEELISEKNRRLIDEEQRKPTFQSDIDGGVMTNDIKEEEYDDEYEFGMSSNGSVEERPLNEGEIERLERSKYGLGVSNQPVDGRKASGKKRRIEQEFSGYTLENHGYAEYDEQSSRNFINNWGSGYMFPRHPRKRSRIGYAYQIEEKTILIKKKDIEEKDTSMMNEEEEDEEEIIRPEPVCLWKPFHQEEEEEEDQDGKSTCEKLDQMFDLYLATCEDFMRRLVRSKSHQSRIAARGIEVKTMDSIYNSHESSSKVKSKERPKAMTRSSAIANSVNGDGLVLRNVKYEYLTTPQMNSVFKEADGPRFVGCEFVLRSDRHDLYREIFFKRGGDISKAVDEVKSRVSDIVVMWPLEQRSKLIESTRKAYFNNFIGDDIEQPFDMNPYSFPHDPYHAPITQVDYFYQVCFSIIFYDFYWFIDLWF